MLTPTPHRPWAAVLALSTSVFAVTATEMMPIGQLPAMAADLHVAEEWVGLSVTIYGLVAGVFAPLLIPVTRRLDRRTLVLAIVCAFAVGNGATALVNSYTQFLLIRLVIGVFHGLMWSVVAGVAIQMVPTASASRATAMTFSGIGLALVIGVPAGSFLGACVGWRAVFGALSIAALIALVAVVVTVPRVASQSSRRADVPSLLLLRGLTGVLVVTAMIVAANYSAYTYISPFLVESVDVHREVLGIYLLTYGIAGAAGNFAAGVVLARTQGRDSRNRLLLWGVGVMTVALTAIMLPLGPISVLGLIAVWGLAYSGLPVVLQTTIFELSPSAKDAATSLYVMVFNVSIAAGAGMGALAISTSIPSAPTAVAAVVGAGACVVLVALHSRFRPPIPRHVDDR